MPKKYALLIAEKPISAKKRESITTPPPYLVIAAGASNNISEKTIASHGEIAFLQTSVILS